MPSIDKYARIEIERRFLLPPMDEELTTMNLPKRIIRDNYIIETNLRLREVDNEAKKTYKLTKKAFLSPGREEITTIYLSAEEYQLLSQLGAIVVSKVRFLATYDDITIGIDRYGTEVDELWVADVEFETEEQMKGFVMPIPFQTEITGKGEFSGLALANRFGRQNRRF
jgi:CYTH domain-containing protein